MLVCGSASHGGFSIHLGSGYGMGSYRAIAAFSISFKVSTPVRCQR